MLIQGAVLGVFGDFRGSDGDFFNFQCSVGLYTNYSPTTFRVITHSVFDKPYDCWKLTTFRLSLSIRSSLQSYQLLTDNISLDMYRVC